MLDGTKPCGLWKVVTKQKKSNLDVWEQFVEGPGFIIPICQYSLEYDDETGFWHERGTGRPPYLLADAVAQFISIANPGTMAMLALDPRAFYTKPVFGEDPAVFASGMVFSESDLDYMQNLVDRFANEVDIRENASGNSPYPWSAVISGNTYDILPDLPISYHPCDNGDLKKIAGNAADSIFRFSRFASLLIRSYRDNLNLMKKLAAQG